MNTRTFKNLKLAMLPVMGALVLATAMPASAATDTKPALSVSGKTYYAKSKAESSALGRWEKQAAIKYGISYSKWGQAKKKSMTCDDKFHQSNGRKLWTCTAAARPTAQKTVCKSGKIKAFWYHSKESVAKANVVKTWEKLAAQHYGVKFSFYKNAQNKHTTCGSDSEYPGKVVCRITATPCR